MSIYSCWALFEYLIMMYNVIMRFVSLIIIVSILIQSSFGAFAYCDITQTNDQQASLSQEHSNASSHECCPTNQDTETTVEFDCECPNAITSIYSKSITNSHFVKPLSIITPYRDVSIFITGKRLLRPPITV